MGPGSPKARELLPPGPDQSVEGSSSLFQSTLLSSMSVLLKSGEESFFFFFSFPSLPYLALSLGGEMANKIVPSGQCGLQEFARTKHFPFALSWRACAQGGGLVSLLVSPW